jgi:hypothetical protein
VTALGALPRCHAACEHVAINDAGDPASAAPALCLGGLQRMSALPAKPGAARSPTMIKVKQALSLHAFGAAAG